MNGMTTDAAGNPRFSRVADCGLSVVVLVFDISVLDLVDLATGVNFFANSF